MVLATRAKPTAKWRSFVRIYRNVSCAVWKTVYGPLAAWPLLLNLDNLKSGPRFSSRFGLNDRNLIALAYFCRHSRIHLCRADPIAATKVSERGVAFTLRANAH